MRQVAGCMRQIRRGRERGSWTREQPPSAAGLARGQCGRAAPPRWLRLVERDRIASLQQVLRVVTLLEVEPN